MAFADDEIIKTNIAMHILLIAICFIVLVVNNEKGANHSDAYSQLLGYRQVTIQCKQARTVHAPCGREPSELLALALNICRYSKLREQEQKAQVINKTANGTSAHFSVWVNN